MNFPYLVEKTKYFQDSQTIFLIHSFWILFLVLLAVLAPNHQDDNEGQDDGLNFKIQISFRPFISQLTLDSVPGTSWWTVSASSTIWQEQRWGPRLYSKHFPGLLRKLFFHSLWILFLVFLDGLPSLPAQNHQDDSEGQDDGSTDDTDNDDHVGRKILLLLNCWNRVKRENYYK